MLGFSLDCRAPASGLGNFDPTCAIAAAQHQFHDEKGCQLEPSKVSACFMFKVVVCDDMDVTQGLGSVLETSNTGQLLLSSR